MIIEDYVSFETAKLLKEKGFTDANCFYSYMENGGTKVTHWENELNLYPKPTLQMAMKWLREVQNIDIAIYAENTFHGKRYSASIWKDITRNSMKNDAVIVAGAITYEQACEVAIKYCLENLILDSSENDARQN